MHLKANDYERDFFTLSLRRRGGCCVTALQEEELCDGNKIEITRRSGKMKKKKKISRPTSFAGAAAVLVVVKQIYYPLGQAAVARLTLSLRLLA